MQATTLKQNTVVNVPVVLQINNTDCGAASLNMILSYFGKWVSLTDTRERCGVSRGGANAAAVLKAGESYGLTGKGLKFSAEGLKESGSFPCILFWDSCHFLVLKGFRGNTAYLNDPAEGEVRLSMEDFSAHYSGICLQFTPGPGFKPEGRRKTLIGFICSALSRRNRPFILILLTLLLAVLTVLSDGVKPLTDQFFLNRVLIPENASMYRILALIMGVVIVIRFLSLWISSVVEKRIQAVLAAQDTTEFMRKLLSLPVSFFRHRTTGDLLTRLEESSQLPVQLGNLIFSFVFYVLGSSVFLIAMLQCSVPLTLICAASIICNFLVNAMISKKRSGNLRKLQQDTGMLMSSTISGIEAINTIKSNGAEEYYFQRWAGYQAKAHNSLCQDRAYVNYFGSLPDLVTLLSNAQILLLGTFFIIKGTLSVGSLFALFGFFQLMLALAQNALTLASPTQIKILLEKKEEVMEASPDPCLNSAPAAVDPPRLLSGDILVKDLCFGYDPMSATTIKHVDLHVRPGGKVALVGPSGSGKSALLKLIGGLETPWSGQILFDGKERSEHNRYVMTSSIGLVLDSPVTFLGSIANNIRMWDTTISQKTLERCARQTGVHTTVTGLKNGYHTLLTPSTQLSCGELQCLELSRVLAQNPSVLLLDEPVSALDAETESMIMKNIESCHLTMIVATNHFLTLRDYDEILVMEEGTVVERGTFDELLRLGGRFSEYAALEKEGPDEE